MANTEFINQLEGRRPPVGSRFYVAHLTPELRDQRLLDGDQLKVVKYGNHPDCWLCLINDDGLEIACSFDQLRAGLFAPIEDWKIIETLNGIR